MNRQNFLSRRIQSCFLLISISLMIVGCGRPSAQKFPNKKKQDDEPIQKVIGEVTQEVGEFKPGEAEVSDLAVKSNANPIQAYAGGARYAIAQTAKLGVTKALQLFNALEGRYPKDHQEFMEKVIKANGIQLPVLPGKRRYQYDVENHELVIVEPQNADGK